MCLGKTLKAPTPTPIRSQPTRDESASAVTDERRRVRSQQGVYGNIFTSVLGDANYGANTGRAAGSTAVATIGG